MKPEETASSRSRRQSRTIWGIIGGIIFAAIWSGSFVATKIALADTPPLWLAGMRLATAGLLLLAFTYSAVLRLWRSMTIRQRCTLLLSGLLSQGCYLGATYWSLTELPTGLVNVIVAALPLVSVPISYLILRESMDRSDFAAAAFGMMGIVIVVIGRDAGSLTLTNFLSPTIVLTIAAVIALATGNALIKPQVSSASIIPICALQMVFSSLLIMGLAVAQNGASGFVLTERSLGAFAYLVLAGSIMGTFLWLKVLEIFTAKAASMFFLFTPLFGLSIGWGWLGEDLTPTKMAGAAIVCCSIMFRALSARATSPQMPSEKLAGSLGKGRISVTVTKQ